MFFFFSFAFSLWGRPKRPVDQLGFPYLPDCKILYHENFTDPNVLDYWKPTMHFRYQGKWKAEQTFPLQTRRAERAIVMKEKEKAHAISHKFRHPIFAPNETIVIQFEARAQFLFTCTSAFMKIFTSPDFEPNDLSNATEHLIEFGPERCGSFNQTRLYFFSTGEDGRTQIEHKLKRPHWIPIDEISHLFTLIIRPNNTFEYLVDNRSMRNGTFIDDFDIPVVDSPMIDDPTDVKPSDWDDRPIIPDPYEKKPADWDDNAPMTIPDPKKMTPPEGWLLDEPQFVMDTSQKKPREWNEQLMGEYKPAMVPNSKCIRAPGCGPYKPPKIRNPKAHGVWRPKYVPNPFYKGEWRPRKIANPKYVKGVNSDQNSLFVLPPITGIGFDVWTAQREFAFTNILIATNETAVKQWNAIDFNPRQRRQVRAMKINYDWIFTDEPPDRPGPGITGKISYVGRVVGRRWDKVQNKPAVIAISLAVILITVPLTIICCDICNDDPFSHIKTD